MDNDQIRKLVLEYFYKRGETNKSSWSFSSGVVKALTQIPRNKIMFAIDFLVDEKFLKQEKTAGGRTKYRITSKGVSQFVPSVYRTNPFSPITVSATGGIFVFGNNLGSIKQETVVSFEEINQLIKVINSTKLSDIQKRTFIGDAETLRAQLSKPKPDKTILQKAMDGLSAVKNIGEALQLLQQIEQIVKGFIK